MSSAVSADYFIARDGTRIYYEIVGDGASIVVVSGGFLVREALDPLTQQAPVVFYDARGRGRSDSVNPDRVSLQHQVDDLEDLRIELGIDSMILLGWSGMGKELAYYTVQYPERVERLIQAAPVPPYSGDFIERMMDKRLSRVDEDALAELRKKREAGTWTDDPEGYCRAEAAVANVMTFADPANVSAYPDVCHLSNEWPENLGVLFEALLPSIEAIDLRPDLVDLDVPRLVIYGEEDAIPIDGVRAWVDGYNNVCLVVIPDAAHWPFVEGADQFFEAAAAFIDGHWPDDATGKACSN